jgi:hypothetical protein
MMLTKLGSFKDGAELNRAKRMSRVSLELLCRPYTSEVPTANWIPRAPVGRGTRGSCIPRSHNHRQRTRPSLINFGY